uniref:Uncharacterized protein n=1 Tax=Rhizophora mucronata TaxID=61149 RepID=A0A2P2NCQ6_RHIMU
MQAETFALSFEKFEKNIAMKINNQHVTIWLLNKKMADEEHAVTTKISLYKDIHTMEQTLS